MNNIQQIIKEICDDKKISFSLVSKNWIIILQKGNLIRYISGYKFDLNNHAVGQICDDKYALYEVLTHFNIPVAEHFILFKNYDKNEAINYSKKFNYNMVIKINDGTCGNSMYHEKNINLILDAANKLLVKSNSISLSPFYDIKTEYRTIVFNGNVELYYGKKKPIVVGDGIKTIYELLCDFNKPFFEKLKKDISFDYVLEKNKVYEYNWQFNLSKGASAFIVDDEILKEKLKNIALEVAKILNISFASIDIIELNTGELLVLEVNSGVMIDNFTSIIDNGRDIAKSVYKKAIEEMFKEKN